MSSAILRILVGLGPFAIMVMAMGDSETLSPAPIPSAVEQCIAGGFEGLCQYFYEDLYENPTICMFLICARKRANDYNEAVIYRPADEGTACGHKKICRNDRCVEWHEDDMAHRKFANSYFACYPSNHTVFQEGVDTVN